MAVSWWRPWALWAARVHCLRWSSNSRDKWAWLTLWHYLCWDAPADGRPNRDNVQHWWQMCVLDSHWCYNAAKKQEKTGPTAKRAKEEIEFSGQIFHFFLNLSIYYILYYIYFIIFIELNIIYRSGDTCNDLSIMTSEPVQFLKLPSGTFQDGYIKGLIRWLSTCCWNQ